MKQTKGYEMAFDKKGNWIFSNEYKNMNTNNNFGGVSFGSESYTDGSGKATESFMNMPAGGPLVGSVTGFDSSIDYNANPLQPNTMHDPLQTVNENELRNLLNFGGNENGEG